MSAVLSPALPVLSPPCIVLGGGWRRATLGGLPPPIPVSASWHWWFPPRSSLRSTPILIVLVPPPAAPPSLSSSRGPFLRRCGRRQCWSPLRGSPRRQGGAYPPPPWSRLTRRRWRKADHRAASWKCLTECPPPHKGKGGILFCCFVGTDRVPPTWSRPRCPLHFHSLICIKTNLIIVVIGPIIDKDL